MKYLIFGGTGFLGRALSKKLLELGHDVCVFSRSEDKHRQIRLDLPGIKTIIGDVRDYKACLSALNSFFPNVIIAAQALKQIDLCEQMPYETVQTNIIGTQNLCEAVQEYADRYINSPKIKFLAISTDKSCAPSTLYGATKLIQERLHLSISSKDIVNNACRYGNVLNSTGSIIPAFKERLATGKDVTLLHPDMTRFLLTVDEAINLVLQALEADDSGKIFVPKAKSCKISDLVQILINKYGNKNTKLLEGKIRPLEKIHEIFFSTEEISRVQKLDNKFIIHPINSGATFKDVTKEYSSGDAENLVDLRKLNYDLECNNIL